MRRVHAILVIVAVLAAPWALVARSFAAESSGCNGYCCPTRGPHSHHLHGAQNAPAQAADMQCHHGNAGRMLDCSMHSGHQALDYGLLSPLAPTSPSLQQEIAPPAASRRAQAMRAVALSQGFLAAPFEPPRS